MTEKEIDLFKRKTVDLLSERLHLLTKLNAIDFELMKRKKAIK